MGESGGGRNRNRQRTAQQESQRDAALDRADGRAFARLPRRVAVFRRENCCLPSGRQCVSASGCTGGGQAARSLPYRQGCVKSRGVKRAKNSVGSRRRLREYFLSNIGRVLNSEELRK